MEKSSSAIKALLCALLLAIIFISMFMPVATFNSVEVFDETEIGWYHPDVAHAGKVKISVVSVIFASGKDVDTIVELYKLEADKALALSNEDTKKVESIQAEIDGIMNGISEKDDARIQEKLLNKKFLRKVALRASMYNAEKEKSSLVLPMVMTLIAIAVLAYDIVRKVMQLVKSNLELNGDAVKALTDYKLLIVAFILHMFTVQRYISKTRGAVSLGLGIVLGLVAMVAFALIRGYSHVLEAKELGADKYKKTIIKQSLTAGALLITVIVSFIGMKMSGLVIYDMQLHYSEFVAKYIYEANKLTPVVAAEKAAGSMSLLVSIISAIPLLLYAALGYMLARTAVVEKVRFNKSRKPVTPLGSFYVGFIFVAVVYLLTFVLFVSNDSAKRVDMYKNCQMSIVFTEYKEEGSDEHAYYNSLSEMSDYLDELKGEYSEEYKDAEDEKTKAEIKADLEDIKLEIKAVEKQMDRVESRKKSNMVAIIALALVAIASEVVFKNVKFESEKIADSNRDK